MVEKWNSINDGLFGMIHRQKCHMVSELGNALYSVMFGLVVSFIVWYGRWKIYVLFEKIKKKKLKIDGNGREWMWLRVLFSTTNLNLYVLLSVFKGDSIYSPNYKHIFLFIQSIFKPFQNLLPQQPHTHLIYPNLCLLKSRFKPFFFSY